MTASLVLRAAGTLFLVSPLFAQNPSTYSLQIGGPDTLGLQNNQNPPTLSNGSDAQGVITYTFDNVAGKLTIEVENTTPQTAGEANPVITGVYFNIPSGAVSALAFNGQSCSGSGTPNFSAAIDLDTTVAPNLSKIGSFGNFNVELTTHVSNGIANSSASQWGVPTANLCMGVVAFDFNVQADNMATLSAQDFAQATSQVSTGDHAVRAALKFQSGGVGGAGSGFIGTGDECIPGLWFTGQPCIGNAITFWTSAAPGCHYCVTYSHDPTPFTMPGVGTLPASPPYYVLISAISSESINKQVVQIPNDPGLVGLPVVLMNVTIDPVHGFQASEALTFDICQ